MNKGLLTCLEGKQIYKVYFYPLAYLSLGNYPF